MPTLSNLSPLLASLAPSIDREGRNIMVAIVKGTWVMSPQHRLQPEHDAAPISFQDIPSAIERNALRLTSDLCEVKPSVDVLVVAPENRAVAARLQGRRVGVALGDLHFVDTVTDKWPFGPISRTAPSRLEHAGTYDAEWQKYRMPLLPLDFSPRYHQDAPQHQRMARPLRGDEGLRLAGLHPPLEGLALTLPGTAVLITGNIRQDYFSKLASLDTVLLWSDRPLITLLWRLPIRPRQKIEEIGTVGVHAIRVETARELYELQ